MHPRDLGPLGLALLLLLSGCRTTTSATLAGDEPAAGTADDVDETGPETPEDAYRPFTCPAGSEPVSLGLTTTNVQVRSEDLGLRTDIDTQALQSPLSGLRLDACKHRSGDIKVVRVYLRRQVDSGEIKHLTLAVDPTLAIDVENVALGTHRVPATKVEAMGLTAALSGDAGTLLVRIQFGDDAFPTILIIKGVQKDGKALAGVWMTADDGMGSFSITNGPLVGALQAGDPFAVDAVCPFGWFRSSKRYALDQVLLEFDACEIAHDLITGEPAAGLVYLGMKITDPGLAGAAGGIIFRDEAQVASVLTFQAGDLDGCDDLSVLLPEAEYSLVVGEKAMDCLVDPEIRSGLKGPMPKGSAGPYKFRYGDGPWQVGWAKHVKAPVPLDLFGPAG